MAWMLKCITLGKEHGLLHLENEKVLSETSSPTFAVFFESNLSLCSFLTFEFVLFLVIHVIEMLVITLLEIFLGIFVTKRLQSAELVI